MFQRHHGPGQGTLQFPTQDADAQQSDDNQQNEHRLSLDRHPPHGALDPDRHGVCAGPTLRSA